MTDVYFATVASSHIHPQNCGRLWKLLDLVVYRWVLRSRLGGLGGLGASLPRHP